MKKILTAIFALCIFAKANAQKDTVKADLGFLFAPQAVVSLTDIEDGSSVITPLFLTGDIYVGKLTVSPFYNLTINAVGGAVGYQWFPKYGNYIVASRSLMIDNTYLGIGFTTPVAHGRATAFIEVGNDWTEGTRTPLIFTGVFIPLVLKL